MSALSEFFDMEDKKKAQVEIDQLRQRVAELELAMENEQAKGIHSCHAGCSLDGCVNRRLRERVADLEAHYQAALEAEQVRFRQLSASQLREKQACALLDMWLWETVNERAEHADARKRTQDYFKANRSVDQDSALREYLAGKMKPLMEALETCTPEGFCDFDECSEALEAARKEL